MHLHCKANPEGTVSYDFGSILKPLRLIWNAREQRRRKSLDPEENDVTSNRDVGQAGRYIESKRKRFERSWDLCSLLVSGTPYISESVEGVCTRNPFEQEVKYVEQTLMLLNRRVPYSIPSDWKTLWFSNLDEFQRVSDANDNNTVSNATVQLGGTAFLHCKVRNLADRTVSDAEISWIRRRDFHVLTSSTFTYTNDERFQVLHPEGSDDWTLQIKYVQDRDNGTYECQIARNTGILSHFVNLNIVVPEAFILGSGEHHVDVGSIINLVCIIEKSPTPPQYVFWYHNNRMINYDTTRGSVTVQNNPNSTQSRLTIHQAVESDTGNYTCRSSNTKPAFIYVFVTEGRIFF
ncbi:Immunoglobulin superfamily member 10 [Eufriesea mexicana]|uniref:Immunoglobulin superfamily member 10 n=1 Tax=Eufriesea mexicana TaxID=516756 RepID=A0A310SJN3_9HYME|nr:Immunoglobulin superfamily member 10 [Eufriesea mexicana]